jgi:signal transduction histidine kinase
MFARLTLNQKGLLLIALPLTVQATFLGLLVRSQFAALASQEWAFHTKQVIAKVADVDQSLGNACIEIGAMLATTGPRHDSTAQIARQRIRDEISRLEAFVADNRRQVDRMRGLGAQAEPFLEWHETEEQLITSGRLADARSRMQIGTQLLDDVRGTIATVLGDEESLDRTRMDAMRKTAAVSVRTALMGGSAVLATTLVLALLYFQGLLKRLAILRDNARRLADGNELRAPLNGFDEISQVDRAFHEMADKINMQKQENDLFVYSVSHDLRSPLVNLQGFSQELGRAALELDSLFGSQDVPSAVRERGRRVLSGNIEESIHYIQTAVGRLSRIIDALLRLSRAGKVVYQVELTDIRSIVVRIIDSLHDSITAKSAQISVGPLPPAWGDPVAIEKIFSNLIINAVQYLESNRPGKIEVGAIESNGAHADDHLSVYFVKDNGLGIPDKYQERVFAPFNRLHPEVTQGEGVGLALATKVAQRLGGRIWLQSIAGVGSTFFVGLPSGRQDDIQLTRDGTSRPAF